MEVLAAVEHCQNIGAMCVKNGPSAALLNALRTQLNAIVQTAAVMILLWGCMRS